MKLESIDDLHDNEAEYMKVLNLFVDAIGRKIPNNDHAIVLETINRWEILCLAELWLAISHSLYAVSKEAALTWARQWPQFMESTNRNNMLVYKLIYNLGRSDAIAQLDKAEDNTDWLKDLGSLTPEQIREWAPQDIVEGIDKMVASMLPDHLELKLRELLEGSNEDD